MKMSRGTAAFWGIISVPIMIGVLVSEHKDEWKESFDRWHYDYKMQSVEKKPYAGGEDVVFYNYTSNTYNVFEAAPESFKTYIAHDAEDVGLIVRYSWVNTWEVIERETGKTLGKNEDINPRWSSEDVQQMCDWILDVYDEWKDNR